MLRTVTFIVTTACTRSCAYCYCSKGTERMSRETARAAVDCLLADPRAHEDTDGLGLDFIGGEPLLEADLIEDTICYVQRRAYELSHPWFGRIGAGISSNGDLYLSEAAQRLTRLSGLQIMITLDGPQDIHDALRGEGSYAAIMRALPTWRRQYPETSTKATISPENLPHLARMIMHLVGDLGLQVHANPVFEAVWEPQHAALFEAQLDELGHRMLEAGIPLERCSLFSEWVGKPACELGNNNWCGAGRHMLAVGPSGDWYPCVRFAPHTLQHQPALTCGTIRDGINWEALEPFFLMRASDKSPRKCMTCEVAGGCAWCSGYDYDEGGTLYHRATNICELHKARARVNRRLQHG